jgi:hypothetical protein
MANKHKGNGFSKDAQGSPKAGSAKAEARREAEENAREQMRAERTRNERARIERKQAEDKEKAGEQITDPFLVKAACDAILRGILGLYAIFGIEVEIREHTSPRSEGTFLVLEFRDALHETGLLRFLKPGIWMPIDLLRKNPEHAEWRGQFAGEWEIFSKFLHSKEEFGSLAATMRRQAFAERLAEQKRHEREVQKETVKKEREEFLAQLPTASQGPALVRDFGPEIITAPKGLWQMRGSLLMTRTVMGEVRIYVNKTSDTDIDLFRKENIFVKGSHLLLSEQEMELSGKALLCRQFREMLRKELASLGETQAPSQEQQVA